MKPKKLEKFLVATLILLLVLPSVGARGVEKPVPHDEFLYEYFSHTLKKFAYSLEYTYEGNDYGLTLAENTRDDLLRIMREGRVYQERGIHARVFDVLPPFYNFSVELITLDRLLLNSQESNDSFALATGIIGTIEQMRKPLEEIKSIELYNGTKVLKFDTGKVEKYLNDIQRMAEATLNQAKSNHTGLTPLSLYVTNREPIVNQTVTFFGTAPANGSVEMIIRNNSSEMDFILPVSRNFFTMSYRFERPGKYFVRAVQGNLSTEWVGINVRKVPTYFIILSPTSAVINTTLEFRAALVDYYSKPLPNREITINGTPFITDPNGTVSLNITGPKEESLALTLEFKGDELHGGAVKRVTIEFTRIPTSITITGPGTVEVGRAFEVKGYTTPAINSTLEVYVNDELYALVNSSEGTFSLNITYDRPETIKVYALFKGTGLYLPSKSNVLLVSVMPAESNPWRYLMALLIVIGLLAYHQRGRLIRKPEKRSQFRTPDGMETRGKVKGKAIEIEIPEDAGKAYSLVRELLSKRTGIPKHLTPRETLEKMRDWEGYGNLKTLTLLHEKSVYGKEELNEDELRAFRKAVEEVITLLGEGE